MFATLARLVKESLPKCGENAAHTLLCRWRTHGMPHRHSGSSGTLWPVFVTFMFVIASLSSSSSSSAQTSETPQQHDQRMSWWREARFGLFIHWGLYAVPAGEWNGQTNHAEWIRTTAQIPLGKYDEFLGQFNPVKFNAEAWVLAAKAAGMKYIVITSKHHDGFALFDSKVSDFDVMATPFKRDIMKELSEACHKHGLKMCWYHSIMDWHHPDYLPRRDWEKDRSAEGADFNRFITYLHGQVTELLTNYGDIGVMWFDGEWESTWSHAYGKPLYELCRKLQPNVIVNNRVDVGRGGMAGMTAEGEFCGDFGTPEQEIPNTGIPGVDWETCMTMNDHWGYNKNDRHWKSSADLIRKLVDIASKGGNFLLNIGPTAEGEFPPESLERLREIGTWMDVNGEAIYGTSAGPFRKLDWGRCTMKRDGNTTTLYLHVFDWPKDGMLAVPGMGNDSRSARLLGSTSGTLAVSRHDSDLRIALPAAAPDRIASVIALEIDGEPIVYEPPAIAAPADILVKPMQVALQAPSSALEVRYTIDGTMPTMQSPIAVGPITIGETCTLKARTFHNGKPASGVTERQFTRVEPKPIDGVPAAVSTGLMCAVYEGDWNALPEFAALKATRTEPMETIALPAAKAQERTARVFSGWIHVPADDVYEFALTSDDGSRLLIGDRVVIDNDGLHSATEKRGVIALAAGPHGFAVEYFNKTGQAACTLLMAPVGQPLKPLDPASLRRMR